MALSMGGSVMEHLDLKGYWTDLIRSVMSLLAPVSPCKESVALKFTF